MSEANTPAPETTLETGTEPAAVTDRREGLAAALDALEPTQAVETTPNVADTEVSDQTDQVTDQAPAPTPEPWEAPPTSWKKDFHDMYKALPPEARQYISQRETEMRQGIEPLIPKAKFADDFERTLQPYQQNIQAAGVPPLAAVQTLMQADHILRNAGPAEKLAYIRQLLPQYGIDPSTLGDPNYAPEPLDPTIQALQNELHNVRNTVTTWQQQQAAQQEAELQSEIERLSQGKEHFEALRPSMSKLLLSGMATSFEDAYEKALRLDETIFSQVQAGQQAAAAAEKKAAADKAAKAARAAAVSTPTSSPGGAPQSKAQDRRTLLSSQLDGISERF